MPPALYPPQHRVATYALVVLATLLAFGSVYAVWVRQQVLDGPTWADTSTRVVQDEQVRRALSVTVADRLTTSRVVRTQALPLLAGAGATPEALAAASATLHATIERTAYDALGTQQAARLWRRANLAAQRELIRILDGRSTTVSVDHERVTVDLSQFVRRLGRGAGVDPAVVALLPAKDTRIDVMTSSDITAAQDVVRATRGLSIVLPALTLLLWLVALGLARGRRRATLMQLALGLALAGAAVLLTRALAGDAVVFALVDQPEYHPAADRVWAIGTSLLRDAGIAVLVAGLLLLGLTALAGNGRWLLNREDETRLLG